LICSKTNFKNVRSFTLHLRKHNISVREYYDKYIHETTNICKCGNEIKTFYLKYGYSEKCSKCANTDQNRILKVKRTIKKRYGVENPSQVKEFQEKRKETNKKRYGVEHAMSNPEIYKRAILTWNKKYGSHPAKTIQIKNKKIKTNKKRYGVENPSQVKEFQEKRKETNKKRYGVEHAMSNPEIYKKSEEAMFKKYGVRKALNKKEFLEKAKQTNLEKRGVEWPMEDPLVSEKITGPKSYRWIKNREERFTPYTEKFFNKEFRIQILKEQHYKDPITNEKLNSSCHLHHIDYDKSNDSRENLIFLSHSIHSKTNTNRKKWQNLLTKINKKFLNF